MSLFIERLFRNIARTVRECCDTLNAVVHRALFKLPALYGGYDFRRGHTAVGHFEVGARSNRRNPAAASAPIGNYQPFKTPIAAQDVGK